MIPIEDRMTESDQVVHAVRPNRTWITRRKEQHCLAHDRDPSTVDNLLAHYKHRELKKKTVLGQKNDKCRAVQPRRRLIHDREKKKSCSEETIRCNARQASSPWRHVIEFAEECLVLWADNARESK
jgi:hypothetical protein